MELGAWAWGLEDGSGGIVSFLGLSPRLESQLKSLSGRIPGVDALTNRKGTQRTEQAGAAQQPLSQLQDSGRVLTVTFGPFLSEPP